MLTGEKLEALANIIYEIARHRLTISKIDATMAKVVMGNVYARFTEDAYAASLARQLREEAPPHPVEKKEGTVEDLMEDIARRNAHVSCDNVQGTTNP